MRHGAELTQQITSPWMFFPHHPTHQQQASTSSAVKHHDGSSNDVRLAPGGWGGSNGGGGGGGGGGSGSGAASRHPFSTGPSMASPFSNPMLFPPSHHAPHHPPFGSHMPQGGFMPNMFSGSPPKESIPMTPLWQAQVMRAEMARGNAAPHHRARTAAVAARGTKSVAVTISDPKMSALTNGIHKKNALSLASSIDRGSNLTPPLSDAGTSTVGPEGSLQPPAPTEKDETNTPEPWTGLDLGGIRLKTLSSALFTFSHITSLYINHNSITSLPPAINHLRQLTLLDATSNELTAVPPELGVLHRLKELLLFDNHLTTLPFELGTLFRLDFLGIEGNPMNDGYRKILAEEGTPALIHHLRDTSPQGAAPPERQWITVEPDAPSPDATHPTESFTALSYNILGYHLANSQTYSYTPSWALEWGFRKQSILQEIVSSAADVVCLQEIDGEQFADFFRPQLEAHGYDAVHYARTRARSMSEKEARAVDGCATFWKSERCVCLSTDSVAPCPTS